MKTLTHPVTGKTFKLGRNKPKVRAPRLSLKNYLFRGVPSPPPTADYTVTPRSFLQDVLGNDDNGDCTVAAAYHIAGTLLGNSSQAIPFVANDVVSLYYQLTGGPDTGLDEPTVLNYWATKGLNPGGHAINGYVEIDPTDTFELQTAIWLFENIYLGASLPDLWVNPMPSASGFIWGVAGPPDQSNGHAFCGLGYTGAGVTIDSWGMFGTLTWDAIAKYCDVYAVLGADILDQATQKAPNGFNWTQLLSDLQSIGPVST